MKFAVLGSTGVDTLQVYKDEGLNAWRYFQGDWSVKFIDGKKTVYMTDFAGTHCAGKLPRNSTIVIEDNSIVHFTENLTTWRKYYPPPGGWNLINHYWRLWNAIDNAVKIRIEDNPVISLSCGHDSGVIACSALRSNFDVEIVSLKGNEDPDIMRSRLDLFKNHKYVVDGWVEGGGHKEIVKHINPDSTLLTGLGADELYTSEDYQMLEKFLFESDEFYNVKNIRRRFPLCDYNVWREYWALHPNLRVGRHKAPLIKYMEQFDFPVYYGPKINFGILPEDDS